jgi:hypothetical protein
MILFMKIVTSLEQGQVFFGLGAPSLPGQKSDATETKACKEGMEHFSRANCILNEPDEPD